MMRYDELLVVLYRQSTGAKVFLRDRSLALTVAVSSIRLIAIMHDLTTCTLRGSQRTGRHTYKELS
jgi:hypothetical protein